jgi:hypothetical protein
MSNKNIDTNHAPALPTYPVQDKLGQVIVNFGLTKLEYGAVHIAGVMAANGDLHPETVAQQAVLIAVEIFKECAANLEEITEQKPPTKIITM